MLLAKMLLGPQQSLISKTMTASSGRGWLRGFKRNMATKKDQSIEFSPVKGAQKAEPVLPTTPQQIPHEALPVNIRFYKWWKTAKGRKFVLGVFITGSAAVLLMHIGKNTFLMNYIKEFYQQYQSGIPVKVDSYTKKTLLPAVMSDLELSQEEEGNLSLFMTNGNEPYSWGELRDDTNAMLGLPFWYQFRDSTEVPLKQMTYGRKGTSISKQLSDEEQSSVHAKNLKEGMALSDKAKKFGLAREIIKVKELQPHTQQGGLAAASVMICYLAAKTINDKMGLFRMVAPWIRGANYIFTMNMTAALYIASKDGFNRKVQGSLDQRAASISKEYAEGGIEYYTKQMQRNAAKRELVLGQDKIYSLKGEEAYELIRRRNKPLHERRDICEEALKSFS